MDRARIVATGTVEEVIANSGVAGRGSIRVASTQLAAAAGALADCPDVAAIAFDNTRPGDIDIDIAADARRPARSVLETLLAADIEPRAFDLQRARLSDAFLTLTSDRTSP